MITSYWKFPLPWLPTNIRRLFSPVTTQVSPDIAKDSLGVAKSPLDENHFPEGQRTNCLLDLQGPSQTEVRLALLLCFLPLHLSLLDLQSHPVPRTKQGPCPKLCPPLNTVSLCCNALLQSPHLTQVSFSSDIHPKCPLSPESPHQRHFHVRLWEILFYLVQYMLFVHLPILLPLSAQFTSRTQKS